MNDNSALDDARNLALQDIGRNVVAFQKMEAMLKFLVANHKIQGLPAQLAEVKERQRLNVDRLTMGSLVDKLFRSVIIDGSNENGELNARDREASMSFSIELDTSTHNDTREAYRLIVHERNALIHQMLVGFNSNSLESCDAISRTLAEQRSRLKPRFEDLRNVVRSVLKGQKDLLALIESDDFLQAIAKAKSVAR